MMKTNWIKVQMRLTELGYAAGPFDGIPGRLTTEALKAFQKDKKLPVKYPGTLGPITLDALDLEQVTPPDVPRWITEARRFLGKREGDAGMDKALGLRAKEISWCGAFVGMTIATVLPKEPLPANPLGARNWLKFGMTIAEPQVGAVAVFYRGARNGWQGHVGYVVGHYKTHLHILGGNQSDKVSIARIAKDRLLGYRWPITAPAPSMISLPTSIISATVTTNEA